MAFPHALYFLNIYHLFTSIFPFKKEVLCTLIVFNVELLEERNVKDQGSGYSQPNVSQSPQAFTGLTRARIFKTDAYA